MNAPIAQELKQNIIQQLAAIKSKKKLVAIQSYINEINEDNFAALDIESEILVRTSKDVKEGKLISNTVAIKRMKACLSK